MGDCLFLLRRQSHLLYSTNQYKFSLCYVNLIGKIFMWCRWHQILRLKAIAPHIWG